MPVQDRGVFVRWQAWQCAASSHRSFRLSRVKRFGSGTRAAWRMSSLFRLLKFNEKTPTSFSIESLNLISCVGENQSLIKTKP